ncbi:sensor domain-containing diguanylate cyclase [Butyrivibrio sp. AE3004]|uniref:sensor domain-containing diguanylate cyclase n=1 Tax=Butyrivibrio sp. AE3004 TaxID=1506994 RepID=UPI000494771D|nr:sensor domain-containing diguanylate cyclase [Butyrivibrio sp. AE3004]
MDFQVVADSIKAMTCIVSVEKLENGGYGKICIVTGNKSYIESIEKPVNGVSMLTTEFVPGKEYTCYLPKDLNFEDYCYRSAVEKKCLHSYAKPDRYDAWFNMTFLPLWPDDGNICYCAYTMEISYDPDSSQIADASVNTAAGVLNACIMLRGTNDFKKSVGEVVKAIRKLCKAQRCCIMLMDHVERTCTVFGEDVSSSSNLKSFDELIDDEFYDIAEKWDSVISGSNCIIAKNERDMEVVKERNPEWYNSLMDGGVKTIVLFPLKQGKELLGYIWAMNFDAENAQKIKEALESTAFILSSEISNYLLLDRLKILSSKDMLTGVMNRNEMNNVVETLSGVRDNNDGPLGVAFADLNGLKVINDKEGHSAGDMLLKRAAMVLREVFDDNYIYRAGGDEFTIIMCGVTREEFEKKILDVRKVSEQYENVSFAIGTYMVDKVSDIRLALRHADENMYEDKKKYYEAHPEKKRRTSKDIFHLSS